jgi:hypothetical protein
MKNPVRGQREGGIKKGTGNIFKKRAVAGSDSSEKIRNAPIGSWGKDLLW